MVKHGAVYLAAAGGAGALIASRIKHVEVVAFEDLGYRGNSPDTSRKHAAYNSHRFKRKEIISIKPGLAAIHGWKYSLSAYASASSLNNPCRTHLQNRDWIRI